MLADRIVLIASWATAACLLLFFTPRDKIREAIVIFMFKHAVTWLFGIIVVELKLIDYPVREFAYAIRTSFAFEYFIYPATCVAFVLHFPSGKPLPHKVGWYLIWPSCMTAVEMLIEKYTDLIEYIHWNGFYTWITLLLTFGLSHRFYMWFYKDKLGAK
ncbi:CBO0543 family protein [Paenibacillus hamazuiensis]|uniref:CBO0543 family protein n=1 Tax=Paenibacillus hamazuiensis TaxID=2936508 RepID=UPI0020107731|nr:CBO0543 family protein [Paenibacillus hamazuiensis]